MNKKPSFISISTYSLKTRFQNFLTPVRDLAIRYGFTPNQVTLFTCFLCIIYSIVLASQPTSKVSLIFLPVFLFIRMALNAIDGMIASHTHNKTAWGMVLNEVCDIVSDLALFAAFITILPTSLWPWLILIALSVLTEFVSLAVFQATGERPNLGPFGKSDRAVYLGLISISVVLLPDNMILFQVYIVAGILFALLTIWNRLKTLN